MPILDKNNTEQLTKYLQFIKTSPYTSATQSLSWINVKENWKNEQVYIEKDEKIVAAASILIKPLFGKYSILYAPRGPVCDFADIELVSSLVDEIEKIAKANNSIFLRFDPEIERNLYLENTYSNLGYKVRNIKFSRAELFQPRFNMILHICDKTFDELKAQFSQSTRAHIRCAEKNGVKVRYSKTKDDLKIFYNLYTTTAERDNFKCREYSYFEKMLNAFSEDEIRIYIGEHDETPICGAICLFYGSKTWYMYGASSNEKRNLMPNYAMQTAMIRWAVENKSELYDFGGIISTDIEKDGLFRFKYGFCKKESYTEYIGEIDKVYNKFLYLLFNFYFKILGTLAGVKSSLLIKEK